MDILRRRKWLVIFSFLFILFAAFVHSVVTPELYKSSTTILVVPQRVPEGYVRSTISVKIEERLTTIQQQVMSRTRLTMVMEELGLFKAERKKMPMEDVVEMMRKRIQIQVASSDRTRSRGEGSDAFTLTFIHENPQMAMLTASRLASFFIDENLKTREQQAVGTSEFLDSQLQETKGKLEVQEEKVKEYKLRYMGELPQQMQANLQILSRLQDQMKMNSDAIRSAQDRKVYIEAQIGALEAQLNAITSQLGAARTENAVVFGEPGLALANELAAKRSQLTALSSKYTENYPEIRRLKDEVAQLEKRLSESNRKEEAAGATGGSTVLRPVAGGSAYSTAPGAKEWGEITRLRAQSAGLDSEIASLKKDREGIGKNIAGLEARVERSPRREQEMISLTRDYENLKNQYDDLLKKKLDADVSQNLEKRQKGEQFQILDPANLPQEPFTPNRPRIFGIAMMAAFLVGIGGAFGLEVLNPTLRGTNDFKHFFDLHILGSIPAIRDELYDRQIKVRRTVVMGGLVSFAAAVTVFLAIYGEKVRTIVQGVRW
jgi:polysaccharide chain length determinant protein (PEP-CTERM system associated)